MSDVHAPFPWQIPNKVSATNGSAGYSNRFAREDHVHQLSPVFTGAKILTQLDTKGMGGNVILAVGGVPAASTLLTSANFICVAGDILEISATARFSTDATGGGYFRMQPTVNGVGITNIDNFTPTHGIDLTLSAVWDYVIPASGTYVVALLGQTIASTATMQVGPNTYMNVKLFSSI